MEIDHELLLHLQAVSGQSKGVLSKVLAEIYAWHTRDHRTWIRERHRELQRQGLRNREIYPRLQAEARQVLVRPDPLTERQIRRIIYG